MINMTIKPQKQEQTKKVNIKINEILSDSSFFPQWENIKEISVSKRKLFFNVQNLTIDLWRKFSFKNSIEKYSLKTKDGKVLADFDLKVYKDSVYIINLDMKTFSYFNQAMKLLLQVAAEKALYNTSEKLVNISLLMPVIFKNKSKKLLESLGFISEPEQSNYEKEIFGETYYLNVLESLAWQKRIKQMPILINK